MAKRTMRLGCVSTGALALALATAPAGAWADTVLPTGGQVVAGQAQIGLPSGSNLVVDQQSQRAVIDWQSFSIGAGGSVQFNNGSGATLNRVTGGDPSAIAGLLRATGSLYLINPAGVVVDGGGKVLTGGSFVASTRALGAEAFMAGGDQSFVGAGPGGVVNRGEIVAGGDAVLIGALAANRGTIRSGGTAALAAGETVVLREATGDARISVAGASGDITNAGGIEAVSAELRAAGGNVYALAGASGLVRATGTETRGGRIWLTAGRDISVEAGVSLDASANTATAAGGEVHIITTEGRLDFAGTALARGGAQGGDGGFIETSGHRGVEVGGSVIDASAPNGRAGQWLIDPFNISINQSAANSISSTLNNSTNVTLLTTAANTGSTPAGTVSPDRDGDIFINGAINWTTNAALTINAYRNIRITQSITGANGTLDLRIGQGNPDGATSVATQTAPITAGTLLLNGTGAFTLTGTQAAENRVANLGTSSVRNLDLRVTNSGGSTVTQFGASDGIVASELALATSSIIPGARFTLTDSRNRIATLTATSAEGAAAAADITLNTSGALTLGNVTAQQLAVDVQGDLAIAGDATVTAHASIHSARLKTSGTFSASGTATLLTPSQNGRFQIFLADPSKLAITNGFTAKTFYGVTVQPNQLTGTSVNALGNRFVFASTPTETAAVTPVDRTVEYDGTAKGLTAVTVARSGQLDTATGFSRFDDVREFVSSFTSATQTNVRRGANNAVQAYDIAFSNLVGGIGITPVLGGTGRLTITPKDVQIGGLLTADDKPYDGTRDATITGTATLEGLIAGEAITLSSLRGQFASRDVQGTGEIEGLQAVTLSGFEATSSNGALASNYNFIAPTGLTARILRKELTVSLLAADKTYGTPDLPFQFTVEGVVAGETLADALTGGFTAPDAAVDGVFTGTSTSALARETGENVRAGGYAISNSGANPLAATNNYKFTPPSAATFTINPRALTIALTGAVKFQAAMRPYIGKPLTVVDLNRISRQVILAYRAAGRPLVDVAVPEQDVTGGVVQIVVAEFKVGEVRVQGAKHFDPARIRAALRLKTGEAVDQMDLIEDLNFLGANPFRRVDVIYQRGAQPLTTDIVLNVTDRTPVRAFATFDNSGTPATRRERIGAGVTWGNAFGRDGQLTLQTSVSPDLFESRGGRSLAFESYTGALVQPLSRRNTLIAFASYQRAAPSLGANLGQIGKNLQVTTRWARTLSANPSRRTVLTLGYDFKQTNNNLLFGGTSISSQKTDIHQASLDLSVTRPWSAGLFGASVTVTGSPGGIGNRNTTAAFQPVLTGPGARSGTPFAKADYVYVRATATQVTPLGRSGFEARTRFTGQLSSANLLPSEQLSAAGPGVLRGYDPNAAIGTQGYVVSQELWTQPISLVSKAGPFADRLQLGAFVEAGQVGNPDRLVAERKWTKTAAAGLSAAWNLGPYASLRADYGWQLRALPGTSKGSLGYLTATIGF